MEYPDVEMSSPQDPDGCLNLKRRKLLAAATGIVGGSGVVAAAVPFAVSMTPSGRARAAGAPVEADFSRLRAGEQMTVEWRGRPVWILRRTAAMLDALQNPAHQSRLADPDSRIAGQQPHYAWNALRSIRPEFLVLVPLCTHLGCIPTFRPDTAPADLGRDWHGGYFCPCHGSKFDLAGRVYRNVPAPTNLVIPPHRYLDTTRIRIGEDPDGSA